MKTEPNDVAYPWNSTESYPKDKGGLTKREYFAAMAMQGILANPEYGSNNAKVIACSVTLADQLIAELNK